MSIGESYSFVQDSRFSIVDGVEDTFGEDSDIVSSDAGARLSIDVTNWRRVLGIWIRVAAHLESCVMLELFNDKIGIEVNTVSSPPVAIDAGASYGCPRSCRYARGMQGRSSCIAGGSSAIM